MGWSPKDDRELFTLNELIHEFSLERLNKNSPIFNVEKLNWFNKKYLQTLPAKNLIEKIKQYSSRAKMISDGRLTKIANLVRDRLTTLADFDQVASIFFKKGKLPPPPKAKILDAQGAIESIDQWAEESITATFDQWIKHQNLDPADFKNTLRLAVFADNTPPIYQSLAVLEKDEVLRRIDDAIKKAKE